VLQAVEKKVLRNLARGTKEETGSRHKRKVRKKSRYFRKKTSTPQNVHEVIMKEKEKIRRAIDKNTWTVRWTARMLER